MAVNLPLQIGQRQGKKERKKESKGPSLDDRTSKRGVVVTRAPSYQDALLGGLMQLMIHESLLFGFNSFIIIGFSHI